MHGAVRVVDEIALAERIERVLPARMQLAREGERVGHLRGVLLEPPQARPAELEVEELEVEVGVVDQHLGAGDEIEELLGHIGELGLLPQVLERQAVHARRAEVDIALGIQVGVKVPLCDAPREDLHTADFDDAVAELGA